MLLRAVVAQSSAFPAFGYSPSHTYNRARGTIPRTTHVRLVEPEPAHEVTDAPLVIATFFVGFLAIILLDELLGQSP